MGSVWVAEALTCFCGKSTLTINLDYPSIVSGHIKIYKISMQPQQLANSFRRSTSTFVWGAEVGLNVGVDI